MAICIFKVGKMQNVHKLIGLENETWRIVCLIDDFSLVRKAHLEGKTLYLTPSLILLT